MYTSVCISCIIYIYILHISSNIILVYIILLYHYIYIYSPNDLNVHRDLSRGDSQLLGAVRDAAGSPVQAPPWKDPGSMGIDMKTHGKSLVLYGFTWVLNMDNMVLWYGDMMKYNFNIL